MSEANGGFCFDFEDDAADNGAHYEADCAASEAEELGNLLRVATELGRSAERMLSHTDTLKRLALKRLAQVKGE